MKDNGMTAQFEGATTAAINQIAPKPTVGRQVMFQASPSNISTATVVGVNADGALNLAVFSNNPNDPPVQRTRGIVQRENLDQHYVWFWPERV